MIDQGVWLSGTVRTFDDQVTELIERRMHEIATGLATAFGCTARLSFIRVYPPTINDARLSAFAANVARQVLGADKVIGDIEPVMPSEDFSFLLQKVLGCYVFLGNGSGEHRGREHGKVSVFGELDLANRLFAEIPRTVPEALVVELFNLLAWQTNDNGAATTREVETWLREQHDPRKLRIAMSLDVYPFPDAQEMYQVLSTLAAAIPEVAAMCQRLMTSRKASTHSQT